MSYGFLTNLNDCKIADLINELMYTNWNGSCGYIHKPSASRFLARVFFGWNVNSLLIFSADYAIFWK